MLLGGISGLFIAVFFFVVAIYVKLVVGSPGQGTISDYGKDPRLRRFIMLATTSISIANIPFMVGLYDGLILSTNPIPLITGALASLFLILTGLTVNHPQAVRHKRMAMMFFSSLALDGIFISLSVSRTFAVYGAIGLAAAALAGLSGAYMLFKRNFTGTAEIVYLSLNSLWIIIFSLIMIFW